MPAWSICLFSASGKVDRIETPYERWKALRAAIAHCSLPATVSNAWIDAVTSQHWLYPAYQLERKVPTQLLYQVSTKWSGVPASWIFLSYMVPINVSSFKYLFIIISTVFIEKDVTLISLFDFEVLFSSFWNEDHILCRPLFWNVPQCNASFEQLSSHPGEQDAQALLKHFGNNTV